MRQTSFPHVRNHTIKVIFRDFTQGSVPIKKLGNGMVMISVVTDIDLC